MVLRHGMINALKPGWFPPCLSASSSVSLPTLSACGHSDGKPLHALPNSLCMALVLDCYVTCLYGSSYLSWNLDWELAQGPNSHQNHFMLGRLHTLCMHSAPNTLWSCADYAAITYDNVYTMATPRFWRLHPHELLVVQMRLRSLPPSSTTAQLPLHLPHTAASEPWSMLMVTLTPGMDLCGWSH